MPPSNHSGGIIAFERYRYQLNLAPPFLRRNIRRSLENLTMGSSPSKVMEKWNNNEQQENQSTPERPLKRRKISSPDDNRRLHDASDNRPVKSRPLTLSPSKFYATSTSNRTISRPSFVDKFRLQDPIDFRKALRIDLTQIVATSLVDEPFDESAYPTHIRCKFTVSIYGTRSERARRKSADSADDLAELVRKTQIGSIIIRYEDGNWTRTIALPQPFIFSSAEIFVNRQKDYRRLSSKDGKYKTYDLAEGYRAQISIDRVGEEPQWPPLQLPSNASRDVYQDDYSLQCKSPIPVGPQRQCRVLPVLLVQPDDDRVPSSYSLHFRVLWSLPHSSEIFGIAHDEQSVDCALPRPDSSHNQTLKGTPASNKSPVQEMQAAKPPDQSPQTGARPTRGRVVNTYNLKALSAQAQGKSPRKPRSDRGPRGQQATSSNVKEISFSFGRADSMQNGIQQQYVFSGLDCPFCGCANPTCDQLRFHLHQEHDHFKFHLRRSTPSSIFFFVEVAKPRQHSNNERTFHLGKPKTLLDLEKYLNGDDSWIALRQKPQHNRWPDHHSNSRPRLLSSSSSDHPSNQSTPNTTRSWEDQTEDFTRKPRRETLVPVTTKPLFHTVTKQVLEPGSVLPDSDSESNENWFFHKHRDIIDDFEDVDIEDKELFHKWNPFVMSSQKSLPDTLVDFVETFGNWLAESAPRREKLAAHMSVMIMQGVVSEVLVTRCLDLIRKFQAKKPVDQHNTKTQESTTAGPRGFFDCICQQHVPLHDRLVCVAKDCKARYYHKACAAKLGIPEVERTKWRCHGCSGEQSFIGYD